MSEHQIDRSQEKGPTSQGQRGHFPIELGDTLGPNGKWKVIRKVECSDIATTWICRNTAGAYVSIKIMTSDATAGTSTAEEEFNSNTTLSDHPGASHISQSVETFTVDGPGGVAHLCKVMALLGPTVMEAQESAHFSAQDLRKICLQVVLGFDLIHCLDVCHGGMYHERFLRQVVGN